MKTFDITWKHMRRSPYQALAAILTMFLTFFMGGIFFLTTVTSIVILHYFESKPQITVFFSDVATEKDTKSLQLTLEETGKTASIKYISKEDALALYKEQNKNDPLLLEMVTADILPASLEVSPTDPTHLPELADVIKKASGVEEVIYQKDVVDALLSWTNAIRVAGGILAGLMVVDAILITMTVISMKIALKKEEVEILKLVGASSWYIQFPFILEGGLYGSIGAFIASVIILGLLAWQRPLILGFLGIIPQINTLLINPLSEITLLSAGGFFALLIVCGFLLGSIGSLVALGRYLK